MRVHKYTHARRRRSDSILRSPYHLHFHRTNVLSHLYAHLTTHLTYTLLCVSPSKLLQLPNPSYASTYIKTMCKYYAHAFICQHTTFTFAQYCTSASFVQKPCEQRQIWHTIGLDEACDECQMWFPDQYGSVQSRSENQKGAAPGAPKRPAGFTSKKQPLQKTVVPPGCQVNPDGKLVVGFKGLGTFIPTFGGSTLLHISSTRS